MLGLARRENRIRFSRPKNKHSPKLAPVLCPVSASLRLRLRSAAFAVARWDFILILLTAKRVKSLIYAGGRRIFRAPWGNLVKTHKCILTISLFRRGARLWLQEGTVPFVNRRNRKNFRRMLTHPQAADGPSLFSRAGGNLIQTRTTRLNDFLFQQSRAVELCPA